MAIRRHWPSKCACVFGGVDFPSFRDKIKSQKEQQGMIILLIADEHAIFYVDDIKHHTKSNSQQPTTIGQLENSIDAKIHKKNSSKYFSNVCRAETVTIEKFFGFFFFNTFRFFLDKCLHSYEHYLVLDTKLCYTQL